MTETEEPTRLRKVFAILTVAAVVGGFLVLHSVLPSAPDDIIRMTGSVML